MSDLDSALQVSSWQHSFVTWRAFLATTASTKSGILVALADRMERHLLLLLVCHDSVNVIEA